MRLVAARSCTCAHQQLKERRGNGQSRKGKDKAKCAAWFIKVSSRTQREGKGTAFGKRRQQRGLASRKRARAAGWCNAIALLLKTHCRSKLVIGTTRFFQDSETIKTKWVSQWTPTGKKEIAITVSLSMGEHPPFGAARGAERRVIGVACLTCLNRAFYLGFCLEILSNSI